MIKRKKLEVLLKWTIFLGHVILVLIFWQLMGVFE